MMSPATIAVQGTTSLSSTVETESHRLVPLSADGTRILLQEDEGRHRLPIVAIPTFARSAEQITSTLSTAWGVGTVLLDIDVSQGVDMGRTAVLEVVQTTGRTPPNLRWLDVPSALKLVTDMEADCIQAAQAKARRLSFGTDSEPFSRLGWLEKLTDWITAVVRDQRFELGNFTQLNGGGAFCLLRFATNKGPLWFKAVGEPNLAEFFITETLVKLFPEFLPKVVAFHPELNGWLMEGGGREILENGHHPEMFQITVQRLAQLQMRSQDHTAALLSSGCRNLRYEQLRSFISPFFEVMYRLMEEQTKNPPAPLTKKELAYTAAAVEEALLVLSAAGIPDTLGHGDFNPGNVLAEGERIVFTDWVEAHVGHPFLTLEYFLAHLRRSRCTVNEEELRTSYAQIWEPMLSAETIEAAFKVTPLIAAYGYAVARPVWQDPSCLRRPRTASFFRSLTRKMKQEVAVLQGRDRCLK